MTRYLRASWALPILCLVFACGNDTESTTTTPMGGTSGTGGASGGGASGGGVNSGGRTQHRDSAPLSCNSLPKPPAKFTAIEGFTNSEDFSFDDRGNYVGVDADGNLVRISKSGKKELWATGLVSTAGIQILPEGSAVIADVTNGAVVRVYPNGARKVLLGGLLYPNGLDIGPDGYIYVAENSGGRVRRVNVDTGEFTIVALGLNGPNGVAFGNDPTLMYVGSFEGSGVYKVDLKAPGELGTATVFARPHNSKLEEPTLACPEQTVGKTCTTFLGEEGKCEKLANVVDCIAPNPCTGVADGAVCDIDAATVGECMSGFCAPLSPCAGKADGASCDGDGTCKDGMCEYPNACTGKSVGDTCTEGGSTGTCTQTDIYLWCRPPGACEGKNEGDVCQDLLGEPGKCIAQECIPDACGASCVTSCSAETLGKPCYDHEMLATCIESEEGIVCGTEDPTTDEPGGIDGLGVDACGNVYASEFEHGIVWRISPKGEIERLVDLPSSWIPNIKWGRGLGGFESDVMYVADRDQERLFGVSVGVRGATEYFESSAQ